MTSSGRKIGRIDKVFSSNLNIKEAQVIQKSLDSVEIKIVPSKGFSISDKDKIIKKLNSIIGPFNVSISIVAAIEKNSAGKFKAVVSNISKNIY